MSAQSIKIDGVQYLAISLLNDVGWHTYWKNPGDAGTPNKFVFESAGTEVSLDEKEWPTPKKYLEAGDIMTYGYEGLQHYFFKLTNSLKNKKLDIHGIWLVCKDICIPGEGRLSIVLNQKLEGFFWYQEVL